ncbi:MAG: hypothetical protein OHK0029_28380 [Armatimonadaceae bacterium]
MNINPIVPPLSAVLKSKRHWTRAELYRLMDEGVLGDWEKIELIAGEIVPKVRQTPKHSRSLMKVFWFLAKTVPANCHVRPQFPLFLASDGGTEPDVCVVRGAIEDYMQEHPSQQDALLVIEVSDATLEFDRGRKASYYAEAGIADYWILNLNDRCVEVFRSPSPAVHAAWGFAYQEVRVYNAGEQIVPLALPDVLVAVADLLPAS